MDVLNDRSVSIRESVHDVMESLVIAIILVIMVIFLFLRKVSATVIPARRRSARIPSLSSALPTANGARRRARRSPAS